MKMNSKSISMANPLIMVVTLLIILIVILAIFRSVSPFLNLGFEVSAHIGDLRGSFELEAFENQVGDEAVFVMYYADWCGHCKRAKPHFQKLIENYQGNVKVMMINCEAPENKELVQSQGIKGFPTIRYYPQGISGQYQEYSGAREYSDFVQYLGSVSGTLAQAPDNAAPV
jgi:thiol-disulfide isomerase/thioredoxin